MCNESIHIMLSSFDIYSLLGLCYFKRYQVLIFIHFRTVFFIIKKKTTVGLCYFNTIMCFYKKLFSGGGLPKLVT